jgi:hypothetical protein
MSESKRTLRGGQTFTGFFGALFIDSPEVLSHVIEHAL